jgi:cytochrome P450
MLLLIAGHETTVNLLGSGLLALLRTPGQADLLRGKPELVPGAVEEMLRYESPVMTTTFRVATQPLEFSGQVILPMEEVVVCIGSANHDPAQFADPECFDITREPNRHLAFAMGSHFCLGAPLARAEARIAFTCLLEYLPRLRMVDETPHWNPGNFMRGLRDLRLKVEDR